MLTFRHKQAELVDFTAAAYHKELCLFLDEANVLGPEYPAVARVKNRFNKHIIIKVDRKFNIAKIKSQIHNLNNRFFSDKQFKDVRLIMNVDPQ